MGVEKKQSTNGQKKFFEQWSRSNAGNENTAAMPALF